MWIAVNLQNLKNTTGKRPNVLLDRLIPTD